MQNRSEMIVGIDFDNTIVCYDGLFYEAAVARGLIPTDTPRGKGAVRDYLRSVGREAEWTELQGLVYGHEIQRAKPFQGIDAFLKCCCEKQVTVNIISHRTRQPFAGPEIDMHRAAQLWLDARNWFSETRHGIDRDRVFLEETKAAKIARIMATNCDVFLDDLPELLAAPEFPDKVERILFDPHGTHLDEHRFARVGSWSEFADLLLARNHP